MELRRLSLTLGCWLLAAPSAEAGLISGVQKIIGGVFALPMGMLSGTMNGPPIIGTIGGTLNGALQSAMLLTVGSLEVVAGAVPLAMKVAPFFLL